MDGVIVQVFQYVSVLAILLQAQLTVYLDCLLVVLTQVALRCLEPEVADKLAELVLVLVGFDILATEVENLGTKFRPEVVSNQSIDAFACRRADRNEPVDLVSLRNIHDISAVGLAVGALDIADGVELVDVLAVAGTGAPVLGRLNQNNLVARLAEPSNKVKALTHFCARDHYSQLFGGLLAGYLLRDSKQVL